MEPVDLVGSDLGRLAVMIGLALIVGGIVLVLAGFLLPLLLGKEGARVEGGAVILVGPVPIVVASSPSVARLLMLLGIVLTVLAALAFILPTILLRR
jgi:uncharacterized membrane protein